jgi:hypothetical protein
MSKYYVLVRILKGEDNTKTECVQVIQGTKYLVKTLKQAKEDIEYIDRYMNN